MLRKKDLLRNFYTEVEIIRLLSVLLSSDNSPEDKKSVIESEFGIAMTEEKEKELDVMCNLSQAVKIKKENEVNIRVATDMLKDGEPLPKIKKYSKLTEEVINAIAMKMGVAVVH